MPTGFEDLGFTASPASAPSATGLEDLGFTQAPKAPPTNPPNADNFSDLGFLPKDQHYANLSADSNFSPAEAVAAGQVDPETGYQVQKLRDNRTAEQKVAAGVGTLFEPSTYAGAASGVGHFLYGLGAAPVNFIAELGHNVAGFAGNLRGNQDAANQQFAAAKRNKAQALLAAQGIEQDVRGATAAVGHEITSTENPEDRSPAAQVKAQQDQEAIDRQYFNDRVKRAIQNRAIASGTPLDTGAMAALARWTTPGQNSVSTEYGPEGLQEQGAEPVSPLMVESMAAAGNPQNLLLAAAPELPGAKYIGGKLVQGAGKALQIPGQLASAAGRGIRAGVDAIGDAVPGARYIPHALGVGAVIHSAPVAGSVAAGVATSKGLQWLGEGLSQQGEAAASGIPSALDTTAANARLAGQNAFGTNAQRVIGDAATRAASTAVGMAPVNAAMSEGDPEQFARSEVGAAAFGGTLDLLHSARPALTEAVRPALRQQGIAAQDANTVEGRASTQFVNSLPDPQKNFALEMQGALSGMPVTNAQGQQVPARMIVLPDAQYQAAVRQLAGPNAPPGGGRGFFWDGNGTAYVNGESSSFASPEEAAHTMGHEFAGHAAMNMLEAAGAKGGPIYDGLIGAAKAGLYNADGTPTPEFQKFVDSYNAKFDPTGQHKQIDTANPNSVEEYLAETAARIVSQKGAGDIALPKNLLDRVTDGMGYFLSGLTGMNPNAVGTGGKFDRTEVASISKAVRDSLYQLAGMKREGGAISRPQTPEEYVQELQQTLAKPRPTDTAENVKAWLAEQKQARKDLEDFQQGGQQFPAGGTAPVPPSASAIPVISRDQIINGLVGMGAKKSDAAKTADAVLAANPPTEEAAMTAAIQSHFGKKPAIVPRGTNVQPIPTQADQPVPQGAVVATAGSEPSSAPVAPVQDETASPLAVGTQEVAPPRPPPENVAADAEQAAIAQEKNQRANTGAARKRVQDAKVEALAEAGKENPSDLHVSTDSLGAKTLVGDINPENPYHAAILKELGITPDQIKGVTDAQAFNGTPAYIRYRSAKSDTEGTGGEGSAESIGSTSKRQGEIEENQAEDRKEWTIQHKVAIPLDTGITKDGGIKKRFLVLSDLLHNAQSIFEWMKENGVPNPYGDTPGKQEQGLVADAQAYAKNHANKVNGQGTGPMKGFPDSAFPNRDPNYQPTVIPKDRFDVLNAMFNDEKAVNVGKQQENVDAKLQRVNEASAPGAKKTAQGVYDRAVKALRESEELQNLNKENGAFYDPNTNETNELRAKMKAGGFDTAEKFYPVIQNLAPQHILGVSDSPIPHEPGDVDSIRPTGFDIDPIELAREGIPRQKAVAAGFMPESENYDQRPIVDWEDTDETGKSKNIRKVQGLSQHEQDIHDIAFSEPGDGAWETEATRMFGDKAEEVKRKAEFVDNFEKGSPSTWDTSTPEAEAESSRFDEIKNAFDYGDDDGIMSAAGDEIENPDEMHEPDREDFEDGKEGDEEYRKAASDFVAEHSKIKSDFSAALVKAKAKLRVEMRELSDKAKARQRSAKEDLDAYKAEARVPPRG